METTTTDNRMWRIVSDYFGGDSQLLYTTKEILDYAADSNLENESDPDWQQFDLQDVGDTIIDRSHGIGIDGYIVAELVVRMTTK